MAKLKDLKKKIKSVEGTLKITMAMKLVSAAKFNKAQHAILNARPYSEELNNTLGEVSTLTQNYFHPYWKENKTNKHSILLVISSNKGLCGGYNSQLIKKVKTFLNKNVEQNFKIYYVGRKAKDSLEKSVNNGEIFSFSKQEPTFVEVQSIAEKLAKLFESKEVGQIYVAYNVFKSAISTTPIIRRLLPTIVDEQDAAQVKQNFPFDFKYAPAPEIILDSLIIQAYKVDLWICCLDSLASEHGSRMSAMENATSNCKEAIRELSLKANKLRQAAITTELVEVVSGAESLNN